jgi:hypothetical protein
VGKIFIINNLTIAINEYKLNVSTEVEIYIVVRQQEKFMRTKRFFKYRLSDGRVIVALKDSKKWFIECNKNELPKEVINTIHELFEESKDLVRLIS